MRRSSLILLFLAACAETEAPPVDQPVVLVEGTCTIGQDVPDSLADVPCKADFEALASAKLDTSIPGARSVKVVLDLLDGDALYFQNSQRYAIHHAFASATLSGNGKPVVAALSAFNQVEYFRPDRRFLLGAVTHYEGPDLWALEIAPYDTMSAAMIEQLYTAVKAHAWFGPALRFHPTSTAVAAEAKSLPTAIAIATTDDIYAGIDYQPLNLATAMGRLRFLTAVELETVYPSYQDIVVLDVVPNDISVVSGIITEEFQTPLSHINVLSRNRKTPNMGLKDATTHEALRALEDRWVELVVGPYDWTIREVTQAEADAFWQAHRPTPVVLPVANTSSTALVDIEAVVVEGRSSLRDALKVAILAYGGKAAHYSVMANTPGIPMPKAFAIPAAHYVKFMEDNGFYDRLDALLVDPEFTGKAEIRDAQLAQLRDDMHVAPIDQAFQDELRAKMETDYPGISLRFRSSTNSEDLEGFPCAGCYESHTGDPADWNDVLDAIRDTWASIWLFRTFEERAYNGIDHRSVVMALLVHHNFPEEEANGVAITANPFDPSGLQPGFFVNVQAGGDVEVVHPPPGTTSDQLLYLYDQPGQPVTYLSHSNLLEAGTTVLSGAQIHELGEALQLIHHRFSAAYGPVSGNNGWYAMDVEFKFDGEPGEVPKLAVKQARPYPSSDP
jgi:pyruvate, water dikinase